MKQIDQREILYDFPFYRVYDVFPHSIILPDMTKWYYLKQGRRVAVALFLGEIRGNLIGIEI